MSAVPIAMKSSSESSDKVTELLWQDALSHLDATNNEVLLPINVIDMIGHTNVDKIKSRLGALIGAPVVAFVDESINALRVMRTPAFSGSAVSVASGGMPSDMRSKVLAEPIKMHAKCPKPGKAQKIPRPPNAFILYRQHHHPKIRAAHPDLNNNSISIMLGKQWKAETDDVKAHYKTLADEEKRKHAEIHPDYQYAPRKPSEKKRRASSRQWSKYTQPPMLPDSPTSTTGPSNVSTPAMHQGMPMETFGFNSSTGNMTGMNLVLGANDMQPEQIGFDTDAFDAMVQRMQADQTKALMYDQLNFVEQPVGDSLNFSDFIADCY